MRTVGLRLAAGLVATGLLLSGCGGSPEPSPAPKPTKSTSPSASAPIPPVMPAAAKAKTKAGAIAFVKHYVTVLNYATFSGETGEAHALDGGGCTSCSRMLKSIETIYQHGGHVEGGAWKPAPVSQIAQPGGRGWAIDVKISYGPQSVFADSAGEAKKYTGGGRLVTFILKTAQSGGWQIAEWTRAS